MSNPERSSRLGWRQQRLVWSLRETIAHKPLYQTRKKNRHNKWYTMRYHIESSVENEGNQSGIKSAGCANKQLSIHSAQLKAVRCWRCIFRLCLQKLINVRKGSRHHRHKSKHKIWWNLTQDGVKCRVIISRVSDLLWGEHFHTHSHLIGTELLFTTFPNSPFFFCFD